MINTTELRVYLTRNDGMSVAALAEKIGKSPATVSRWFENKDMPTKYAEVISQILHIPPNEISAIFFNGVLPDGLQKQVSEVS